MEAACSVRFIPTDRSKDIRDGSKGSWIWNGNKPALCFPGVNGHAHCIIIDDTEIHTVNLPLNVVEKSRVVSDPMGSGIPYAPARFIKRIAECGKPVSEEARKLIESVNGSALPKTVRPPQLRRSATTPPPQVLKTAGAMLISSIAAELKLPTPKLRRFLRGQGLHAPYTDESIIRKALKKYKKEAKK